MKNTKLNLVHFISVLSFSLLILSVSAQQGSTHFADVAAIAILQSTFPALILNSTLDLHQLDPCLPKPYPWITCSSDYSPRITALKCGNKDLIGAFVDFSPMDALEIIDFSGNHLTQDFPDFVTKFPKLRELNLANNNLFGTVPTSLEKNKNLKLTLTGNKILCFSDDNICGPVELARGIDTNEGSRKNSMQIILGTVISMFVMIWVIV